MSRIEKLKEMLQNSPEDSFLKHALGLEYSKLGLIDEAIAWFKMVIDHEPEYVGSYYHLAKSYEMKGEQMEAIATFEQGIKIATKVHDMHARNELQMALDDLQDE